MQILVYEGEMERAQGQLEAEMQNLEEEKNRVIEEAFIRAESEMKAVHENLAGACVCSCLPVSVPVVAASEHISLTPSLSARCTYEPVDPAACPAHPHM